MCQPLFSDETNEIALSENQSRVQRLCRSLDPVLQILEPALGRFYQLRVIRHFACAKVPHPGLEQARRVSGLFLDVGKQIAGRCFTTGAMRLVSKLCKALKTTKATVGVLAQF